jgi:hypothetical protein
MKTSIQVYKTKSPTYMYHKHIYIERGRERDEKEKKLTDSSKGMKYRFQWSSGKSFSERFSVSSTMTAFPNMLITYLFTLPYTCILRAKTRCSAQVLPIRTTLTLPKKKQRNTRTKNKDSEHKHIKKGWTV